MTAVHDASNVVTTLLPGPNQSSILPSRRAACPRKEIGNQFSLSRFVITFLLLPLVGNYLPSQYLNKTYSSSRCVVLSWVWRRAFDSCSCHGRQEAHVDTPLF